MILVYHRKYVYVGCIYFGYKMSLHQLMWGDMEWRKPQRNNFVLEEKCGSLSACGFQTIGF